MPCKKNGTGGCQLVPTLNGKKNSFKLKLLKIKFHTKKCLSPHEEELGDSKD